MYALAIVILSILIFEPVAGAIEFQDLSRRGSGTVVNTPPTSRETRPERPTNSMREQFQWQDFSTPPGPAQSQDLANDFSYDFGSPVSNESTRPGAAAYNAGSPSTGYGTGTGQFPYMDPANASRKVFATMFQSCEVLATGLGYSPADPRRLIKDLKNRGAYPSRPQCTDRSSANHDYLWGGKPRIGQEIDVFRRMDCSGFLSTVFGAAGLKLRTDGPRAEYRNTVGFRSLVEGANSAKSCVAYPRLSRVNVDEVLKAGDILNQATTNGSTKRHVVLVESVGKDPLGIGKARSKNDCGRLTHRDFNFTYIHSSSGGNLGLSGVHRVHASRMYSPGIRTGLMQYARAACRARFDNQPFTPGEFSAGPSKPFGVLRHLGSAKPGCITRPMRLKGSECVGSCNGKIEGGV